MARQDIWKVHGWAISTCTQQIRHGTIVSGALIQVYACSYVIYCGIESVPVWIIVGIIEIKIIAAVSYTHLTLPTICSV